MDNNYDLILSNALAMTPSGLVDTEIAVKDGKIVAIGELPHRKAVEILDCKHRHVLPGVIDSQVHFREPGNEHKEDLATGTLSAVAGGVTAVFEMPNTNPLTITRESLDDKLNRADGRAWCDYAFYVGGTADNADDIAALEKLDGCSGVKIFMGSSTGNLLLSEDEGIEAILRNGRRRVAIHAEDEARLKERYHLVEGGADPSMHPVWRDEETALRATQRIVALARKTKRPVHVLHITTKQEMEFLATQKDVCSVECLPHHLTLSAPECYERLGTYAQMNPPVRDKSHQDALWKAVESGVVDVLGSDHAPHTRAEKDKPYPQSPSGMTGVQTLVPIMLDHVNNGRLSLARFVDLVSAGPQRLFNIVGKGRIAVGYDADFTIVDLKATRTIENKWIQSKCGWTPYDGKKVMGWPVATIIRGNIAMRDDEILGAAVGQAVKFIV